MQKIRKGDKVIVLAGKDKGRSGIVLKMNPKENTALVQGINIVKRHQRQTQTEEAGIVSKEAPIHVSNLAFFDVKTQKPTRIGFVVEDGKKFRVAKRSGEKIDG